mmetsp:Transcript_117101/g.343025  ORF Transcript_117101/g.343025 Transcript_117101/m.343025 type:complete len:300 (-) Transcript_117101:322-1221(-)
MSETARRDKIRRAVTPTLTSRTIPADALAYIEVLNADDMQLVVETLVSEACNGVRTEACANVAVVFSNLFPRFPSMEGDKPHTFMRLLLNTCQKRYEDLCACLEQADIDRRKKAKDKKDLLSIVKFVAHLCLNKMMPHKIIHLMLEELLGSCNNVPPAEHKMECVCGLLLVVGDALADRSARYLPSKVLHLVNLVIQSSYSKRTKRQVGHVLHLYRNRWQPKIVLTVHSEVQGDILTVSCTNMAGIHVCALDIDGAKKLPDLRDGISKQLKTPLHRLVFVLPQGQLLAGNDETPLREVL